ncbi:hypothetical protein HPP92_003361 [Vanilla planifolia]|uniref:Uncharacterized protein n=1 Tax=Vanilla planifolia TaxID=51239 RepID=A0A835VIV9_VANPL|nr:hypothetical protein HPP92_003361 [Vanilla planifolia]
MERRGLRLRQLCGEQWWPLGCRHVQEIKEMVSASEFASREEIRGEGYMGGQRGLEGSQFVGEGGSGVSNRNVKCIASLLTSRFLSSLSYFFFFSFLREISFCKSQI